MDVKLALSIASRRDTFEVPPQKDVAAGVHPGHARETRAQALQPKAQIPVATRESFTNTSMGKLVVRRSAAQPTSRRCWDFWLIV